MPDSFNPYNGFNDGIEDAVFTYPEGPFTGQFALESLAQMRISCQITNRFLDPVLCVAVEFFKALLKPSSES